MLIFKIVAQNLWYEAQTSGEFGGAPVDLADGYMHFSTADQLERTASLHFAGQSDLLVVAVEAESLGEALKWEPARDGAKFPHLYRALSTAEAVWARPLSVAADGSCALPPLG